MLQAPLTFDEAVADIQPRIDALVAAEVAAARQQGLAAARSEVDAAVAGHREAQDRLTTAADALVEACRQLTAQDRAVVEEVEERTLGLAADLAEAIVTRELSAVDNAMLESLRRAAAFVPDRGDVIIRIHPADAAEVPGTDDAPHPGISDALGAHHRITLAPDDSLQPGTCVVHVGALRIDSQLAPALERMRAALGI